MAWGQDEPPTACFFPNPRAFHSQQLGLSQPGIEFGHHDTPEFLQNFRHYVVAQETDGVQFDKRGDTASMISVW